MLPTVLLGIALLIGLVLLGRWLANADPKLVATALRWFAGTAGAILLAYLVISERWGLLPVLLFVVLPWLSRTGILRRPAAKSPGRSSEVETPFLRMTLDHDSAALDGEVRTGAFAGKRLGELGIDQLRALRAEAAADADSLRLIEAYLDRIHPGWRDQGAAPSAAMSRDEAHRILGLTAGATESEIREAHKRLMSKLHPDRGGSDYLAAQINRAKDVLLGGGSS